MATNPSSLRRHLLLAPLLCLAARPALALYDPKPDSVLAGVQGEWQGSLTYRDYSKPDRMVTLPTRLFIALGAPNELVLHFVFNDGPNKSVFSYDRMRFEFDSKQLIWTSGSTDKPPQTHAIGSSTVTGNSRELSFERADGDKKARYILRLSPQEIRFEKEEVAPSGEATFRNRYEFTRRGN